MKLILFDIDGTLISTGGAGVRSLDYAFRDAFGIPNAFAEISMAGKTDVLIVKEALARHGLPNDNGVIPQILDLYLKHLAKEILTSPLELKPGIKEALDVLKTQPEFTIGLLTGNLEDGARIKLQAFGMYDYFLCGAFGSDHEDRNQLLPIAVSRFQKIKKQEIGFSQCVIIGDTPRDVACAKPYGAACIAVATGPYSVETLRQTEADVVMEDLSDTTALLETLMHFS
jgi:phosphoglycolate phosphatase-like HAD superfamily hydrolase